MTLQLLNVAIMFMAFLGLMLIGYALAVAKDKVTWKPIESVASDVATYGTYVSLFITAVSIYMPSSVPRPPLDMYKFIVVPFLCVVAVAALFNAHHPFVSSVHVTNGVNLLALAGALFPVAAARGGPHGFRLSDALGRITARPLASRCVH